MLSKEVYRSMLSNLSQSSLAVTLFSKTICEHLSKRSKSTNIDNLKESGTETVHKKEVSNAL